MYYVAFSSTSVRVVDVDNPVGRVEIRPKVTVMQWAKVLTAGCDKF